MYNKWLLWFLIISLRRMKLAGCWAVWVFHEPRIERKTQKKEKALLTKRRRNKTSNINYLNNTFVCLSKDTDWRLRYSFAVLAYFEAQCVIKKSVTRRELEKSLFDDGGQKIWKVCKAGNTISNPEKKKNKNHRTTNNIFVCSTIISSFSSEC